MNYRGYELEKKHLMVGWQVIVTKGGAFVKNGAIEKDLESAIAEAHAYVDGLVEKSHYAS
jgi:hypothetical protein